MDFEYTELSPDEIAVLGQLWDQDTDSGSASDDYSDDDNDDFYEGLDTLLPAHPPEPKKRDKRDKQAKKKSGNAATDTVDLALSRGDYKTVKSIFEDDNNLLARISHKSIALGVASGHVGIVKILHKFCVSHHYDEWVADFPLIAAQHNQLKLLKWMHGSSDFNVGAMNSSRHTPLSEAAAWNSMRVLRWMVDDLHFEVNPPTGTGKPPLLAAVELDSQEAAFYLIHKNANVGAVWVNSDGERVTALKAAAKAGHVDLLGSLISRGADPNQTGINALGEAASAAKFDAMEFLIKNGALLDGDGRAESPLASAIKGALLHRHKNPLSVVKLLIKRGADPLRLDPSTELPPIVLAAMANQPHISLYLYKKYPATLSYPQWSFELFAALWAHKQRSFAEMFVDQNAPLTTGTLQDDLNVRTPLASYVANVVEFDGGLVKKMIDKGAKAEAGLLEAVIRGSRIWYEFFKSLGVTAAVFTTAAGSRLTLLGALCLGGEGTLESTARVDLAQRIIEDNRDALDEPQIFQDTVTTPLGLAARQGYVDIVQLLLHNGAKVNGLNDQFPALAQGSTLRSPLSMLLDGPNPDLDVLSELANHGVKPESDTVWLTVDKAAVLSAVIDMGGDVNGLGQDGTTPLVTAAAAGLTEAVSILIKEGFADVNKRVKYGPANEMMSALDVAAQVDNLGAALVLLNSGAVPSTTPEGLEELIATLAACPPDEELVELAVLTVGRIAEANLGVDVNFPHKGSTPLQSALSVGNGEMVKLLCTHGASLLLGSSSQLHRDERPGNSPMHVAVVEHLIDGEIIEAVEADVWYEHVNSTDDDYGRSPLSHACFWGQLQMVEAMMIPPGGRKPADFGHSDDYGNTMLHDVALGALIGTHAANVESRVRLIESLTSARFRDYLPYEGTSKSVTSATIAQAKKLNVFGQTPVDIIPATSLYTRTVKVFGSTNLQSYGLISEEDAFTVEQAHALAPVREALVAVGSKPSYSGHLSYFFSNSFLYYFLATVLLYRSFFTQGIFSEGVGMIILDAFLLAPALLSSVSGLVTVVFVVSLVLLGVVPALSDVIEGVLPGGGLSLVLIWCFVFLLVLVVRAPAFMTVVSNAGSNVEKTRVQYVIGNFAPLLAIAKNSVSLGAGLTLLSPVEVGWSRTPDAPFLEFLYDVPVLGPVLNFRFPDLPFDPSVFILFGLLVVWTLVAGMTFLGLASIVDANRHPKLKWLSPDFFQTFPLLSLTVQFVGDVLFINAVQLAFQELDCDASGFLDVDPTVECFSGFHVFRAVVAVLVLVTFIPTASLVSLAFLEDPTSDVNLAGRFVMMTRLCQFIMVGVAVFITTRPLEVILVTGAGCAALAFLAFRWRVSTYRGLNSVGRDLPTTPLETFVVSSFVFALLTGPLTSLFSLLALRRWQGLASTDLEQPEGKFFGAPIFWCLGPGWLFATAVIVARQSRGRAIISAVLWVAMVAFAGVWTSTLIPDEYTEVGIFQPLDYAILAGVGFIGCLVALRGGGKKKRALPKKAKRKREQDGLFGSLTSDPAQSAADVAAVVGGGKGGKKGGKKGDVEEGTGSTPRPRPRTSRFSRMSLYHLDVTAKLNELEKAPPPVLPRREPYGRRERTKAERQHDALQNAAKATKKERSKKLKEAKKVSTLKKAKAMSRARDGNGSRKSKGSKGGRRSSGTSKRSGGSKKSRGSKNSRSRDDSGSRKGSGSGRRRTSGSRKNSGSRKDSGSRKGSKSRASSKSRKVSGSVRKTSSSALLSNKRATVDQGFYGDLSLRPPSELTSKRRSSNGGGKRRPSDGSGGGGGGSTRRPSGGDGSRRRSSNGGGKRRPSDGSGGGGSKRRSSGGGGSKRRSSGGGGKRRPSDGSGGGSKRRSSGGGGGRRSTFGQGFYGDL